MELAPTETIGAVNSTDSIKARLSIHRFIPQMEHTLHKLRRQQSAFRSIYPDQTPAQNGLAPDANCLFEQADIDVITSYKSISGPQPPPCVPSAQTDA